MDVHSHIDEGGRFFLTNRITWKATENTLRVLRGLAKEKYEDIRNKKIGLKNP